MNALKITSLLPLCAAIAIASSTEPAGDAVQTLESSGASERLIVAADYSASHEGDTMLVMQAGDIVFERYEGEVEPDTAIHMHSSTKAFWGPVIAAMIEDGLVTSFDELASVTLPEWDQDERKATITLRHLLQLNAGLAQDIRNLQGHDRGTLAPDLYTHAVALATVSEPGRNFVYGPSCYYALGEIMKRKLAPREQSPLDYLRMRILEPIGVEIGDWVHDESENPHIPNGASLTARNWVRFGQFMLQEGAWEGKQLINRELMVELRQPSEANPGHGLAIWLNTPAGFSPQTQRAGQRAATDPGGLIYPGGDADIFAAMGAGKNRLYVIPEKSMVVVRQSKQDSLAFQDREFLRLILEEKSESATDSTGTTSTPASPALRLQQAFQALDLNGDGLLDETEAGDRPFFKPADANRDGLVDVEETRQYLRNRATTEGVKPD